MDSSPQPQRRPAQPVPDDDPRLAALRLLVGVVDRLRAPDGCPWDREQSLASMGPHLIEEAHELVEALEEGGDAAAAEEAGDLLMNVALVCRIAQDEGRFDLGQVAGGVAEKLVRRHPHVFAEVEARDAAQALASWESVKRGERDSRGADPSALAGIPRGLPALQRAARTAGKALSAGFRWQSAEGAFEQLGLELAELGQALESAGALGGAREGASTALDGAALRRAQEELGDVLFAAACLGAYLGVDPEGSCRAAVRRFEERFRRLEAGLERPMAELSLDELAQRWRAGRGAPATPPEPGPGGAARR